MPLDKETVKKFAVEQGLWPRFEGIVEKRIDADDMREELFYFAQAIYDIGVKEERERCLDICNQFASIEGVAEKCAEAIRKG